MKPSMSDEDYDYRVERYELAVDLIRAKIGRIVSFMQEADPEMQEMLSQQRDGLMQRRQSLEILNASEVESVIRHLSR